MIQWLQRLTAAAAILLVSTLGMLFLSTQTSDAGLDMVLPRPVAQPVPDGKPEAGILLDPAPDHAPLLDQAMILALNDPSWEMPFQ